MQKPPTSQSGQATQPGQATPVNLAAALAAKLKATAQPVPAASTITALKARGTAANKKWIIGATGNPEVVPYAKAKQFTWQLKEADGIVGLAHVVTQLSKFPDWILIRGAPIARPPQPTLRNLNHFAEPDEGCRWVMLDFDDIPVQVGVSPIELAAIEVLIQKLPSEFHNVTYFYQFSSSSGILNSNGTLRKSGVNAHVFFWLNRPVHGKDLDAWLKLHCIETGFLKKQFNSADNPRITYGIDPSVLVNPVQPHYVALPHIGPGVKCILAPEQRQGLIEKRLQAVAVPDFEPGLRGEAASEHAKLRDSWKRECGYVAQTSLSRVRNVGVSVDRYLGPAQGVQPTTGRVFLKALVQAAPARGEIGQADQPVQFARLYFEGEGSPGSWWVASTRPTVARRFGDDESMQLKVLSEGAYAHVRDVLKWFEEVGHRDLSLTPEGYLPPFNTFLQARNTLILAPTGSGKTTAFCSYALEKCQTDIIVYAAQTIALTNQMVQELRQRQIPAVHYRSYRTGHVLLPGVYVTTNKSLKKFVEKLKTQLSERLLLVIDEAHVAIDDFMQSEHSNRLLEEAMRRANQTIFMTGTITDLQVRKISDLGLTASGSLVSTDFEFCEFTPARNYRLLWADAQRFGADLVALMRSHQVLKANGQSIPRTVVIVPTSKMRPYQLLLEHFGLQDDAMVVSRLEASPQAIEEARASNRPWLVSSPLFSLGLNFVHPPVRLWTHFGALQVDESQIVQTVNRANRTSLQCEVRLYAGRLDALPYDYLDQQVEAELIEGYLQGEANVHGDIHPTYQLNRMTYLQLRRVQEQVTAKALYQLKSKNAIQNYRIVEQWEDDLHPDPGDIDLFKSMYRRSGESYDDDVLSRYRRHAGEEPAMLFELLRQNKEGSRYSSEEPNEIPKQYSDEQRALLAALTGRPEQAKRSGGAEYSVVARLHAEMPPFFTEQFAAEKTQDWKIAIPYKVEALIEIVGLLERMRSGDIDGVAFGKKMRLKGIRHGVLALAQGEGEFIKWQSYLKKLDEYHVKSRTASQQQRMAIDKVFFQTAKIFLGRIGVDFEKTAGGDRRSRLDPTKPVVPNWNFDEMRLGLEILAESIKNRTTPKPDVWRLEREWKGPIFALKTCETCVHCSLTIDCALGRPIDYTGEGGRGFSANCSEFKGLSARVLKLKADRDRHKI